MSSPGFTSARSQWAARIFSLMVIGMANLQNGVV
jgi:hypothetical protein